MKRITFSAVILFTMAIVMVSCQKESIEVPPSKAPTLDVQTSETPTKETAATSDMDFIDPAALLPPPVPPVGVYAPDLVVWNQLFHNIGPVTNSCGGTLPNVSCFGGQRVFKLFSVIWNNGPAPIPPGNLEVKWTNATPTGSTSMVQSFPHTGIPSGNFIVVSRQFYMGPCGCVPPPNYFKHAFVAEADPNNLISELNEGNNTSAPFISCDGC